VPLLLIVGDRFLPWPIPGSGTVFLMMSGLSRLY